ncbi:MAG: hypothetical protein AAGM22_28045 [Acidobacteriota bacterium]
MEHLIRGELDRFRFLTLGAAVVHLLVLRVSMTLTPLFVNDAAKTSVALMAYGLFGAGLGLYQMSTYRRGHLWAWLVHRPVGAGRLFVALSAAAATVMALAVVAPALAMTVYLDWLTPTYVDARHYAMLPFLFGLSMCFYWLGAFVAVYPRRGGALAGVVVIFFLSREAAGLWIFASLAAVAAWLAALAWAAFRPSPTSDERRPAALLGTVLPVAYAIFWILMGSIALVRSVAVGLADSGVAGFRDFAWDDYWDEGELMHLEYLDPQGALAHGLRLASTQDQGGAGEGQTAPAARAAALLAQIDLADVYEPWGPRFSGFADRHQLFFDDRRHELLDAEGEVRWTFSHDLMLFVGEHRRTGEAMGFLGLGGSPTPSAGGSERFASVPFVVDSKWLVFPRRLVEVDFALDQFDLRFELPPGETVAMPFNAHRSFVALLSTERLYLFDPRSLELDDGPLSPLASVAIPGSERNLSRFQIAEMIDSYLVSFVFGARNFRDFGEARQVVVELPIGGGADAHGVVSDLALGAGFPNWYRRRGFVLSPLLQHGHDLLWNLIGPDREERVSWADIRARAIPGDVLMPTAMLTLGSLLATFGILAWRRRPTSDRGFWLAVAALCGLPGALACLALTTRNEAAGLESMASSERAVDVSGLSAGRSPA